MNAMTMLDVTIGATPVPMTRFEDPLDDDAATDAALTTTRRGLVRLALVAAETGARFQREGVAHDPMAWLLSPRALFDGACAIDACLGLGGCLRGVLIHGLSLGLDADPAVIDALAADDDDGSPRGEADGRSAKILPFSRSAEPEAELRLFTATVVAHDFGETVHAFHASLALDEAEVAGRLYCRIGAASADARIVAGFDAADPLVAALVAPAMCDTLELVAADPGSPLAAGLDVNIEQRFLG
ncbi:hypothetical protein ASE86_07545 [Sphingomonas sp. Leaf33]|uniref:hypothetical protein n=1 Tax=Sphingomonas sp. Leaf33 TaxID=1736215 RepID=UPI0006F3687C|nr:hypothetical protein [Sphingomonas sp. Leaf33]KQN26015.1 hypothetical protein ASE86_07545 [Sphingomonas sp. Leaf33]